MDWDAGLQPTDIFGEGQMMELVAAPNKYICLWEFRGDDCPIGPRLVAGLLGCKRYFINYKFNAQRFYN